ncbi:DMT family transporter [Altererythrobacter sp. MF3-039]|uniref:DMT family transporter n=1 Tax=Altererythrobacter sp. MF3-039 TaxID=3252901 RepID=UPI00390CC32A
MSATPSYLRPIVAVIIGIALFSTMDAVMKSASLAIGAFSAYFLRCIVGFCIIAPVWWLRTRAMPSRAVMRIHIKRSVVVAFMGLSFFYAIVRLPLAEAIAISFIAPLIALFLAAVLLGEKIELRSIVAGVAGLAGVLLIVGGKVGSEEMTDEVVWGLAAVVFSAVLYAWNLILQREQALVAKPTEVSTFQNGIVALVLLGATPFLLEWPNMQVWGELVLGALLAISAAVMLTWAYARAEAQVLVPFEYTGFLWAVLLGWLMFGEDVTGWTISGASLIILACLIASRRKRPEQSAL